MITAPTLVALVYAAYITYEELCYDFFHMPNEIPSMRYMPEQFSNKYK